ncbi:SAM-dependent methyltransferase [Streptomyces sp. NPDC057702]|uniref:SAM-dependent methyltransferase n=1 Tax=unclassified Streptomyces TaxID=2593676 RepID=UPI00368C7083
MSDVRASHAEGISAMYDQSTEFFLEALGGSIHYGYWPDASGPGSMEAASRRMTALMVEKLGVTAGQSVLDIGCGAGRPAVDLAVATGAWVTGVTISPEQVRVATELAAREGLAESVRFQRADANDLPFAARSFDGAWLFESLLHMSDPESVLRQTAGVLRPGAPLVISNVVLRGPLSPADEELLATFGELVRAPSILPLAVYPELLARGGFALKESIDISEQSVRGTYENCRDAVDRLLRVVEGGDADPAAVDLLKRTRDISVQFTGETQIGYAVLVATRG